METIIAVTSPMAPADSLGADDRDRASSAVSWAAIVAGAVVAAAASLILLALGSGLGLAAISPWSSAGVTIATFTVASAIWLILTQWIASGLGGYLTGRLRIRWLSTHPHEIFFRDTAHGFLAWALATVATAALLGSAAIFAGGAGAHATASSAASIDFAYDVDTLLRTPRPSDANTAEARAEAARILAAGAVNQSIPADDSAYLTELVAAQTGLSTAQAQQRVATVIDREQAAETQIKQSADKARKAGAALAMFTALSMLIGALIASIAAALGGQQRDEHI
jgi:hypothetical protein